MKAYFSKSKTFVFALVTLFTTSVAAPAFATEEDEKNAHISYVGDVNDLPVYRLSLANKTNEVYYVSITDNSGNLVYNEKVSGTNIVRNYQFDADIYNDYDLTFTISNVKGKAVNVYNVSKSKKIINEVAVNRVK